MTDYAEQIKQAVPFRDAMTLYGVTVNRAGFARCPFHAEKTGSFKAYKDSAKCYGCGWQGDVLDFTGKLFNLSFRDSMKKLNNDFHLGLTIGEELSEEARKEANRAAYQRRKEQERRKQRHDTLLTAYHSALDEWIRLDTVIRNEAPQTPFDGFTEAYVDAVKRIDRVGYELDVAERELRNFERMEGQPAFNDSSRKLA